MRDHPDYILPLALIAFGLLAQLVAWGWSTYRQRSASSYTIRNRGRTVKKRGN